MAETTEHEMLVRFMEGLKQASGSAHQLCHAQQNPYWLTVRDLLEQVRERGAQMAIKKAIGRQAALTALDRRQALHVVKR